MDIATSPRHFVHSKSNKTVDPPRQKEAFQAKIVRAHDGVISQAKIYAGLSNRELITIHKLYQIQLYINWQSSQLGSRCLRADEWLTYACDFFQPVFALIHSQSDILKDQLISLSPHVSPSGRFPHVWTKIVGQDLNIDKDAAQHLSETIAATISEVAMLFPNMKAYQRSYLLDPSPNGREHVTGYLSRNINTQNVSDESDIADLEHREKPSSIEYWLRNLGESHENDPAEQSNPYGNGSPASSSNYPITDLESDWAKDGPGNTTVNPLAIAFDPEHKNNTLQGSVLDLDGIEYFTSATAFYARLRLLEYSEVLGPNNPDFGDVFQSMLRGSALWWFIRELEDEERDALRTASIVGLGRAIMWRFPVLGESQARRFLEDRDGYLAVLTAEGCSNCADLLRIQMMQLCRLAQVADLADQPQIYIGIWERLEPQLQQFFDRPDPKTGNHDSFVALVDKGLEKALKGERALPAMESLVGDIGKPDRIGKEDPALGQEEKANAEEEYETGGSQSYCMCTSCCEKLARKGLNNVGASAEQDVGFRMRKWPFLGRAPPS